MKFKKINTRDDPWQRDAAPHKLDPIRTDTDYNKQRCDNSGFLLLQTVLSNGSNGTLAA